MGLLIYRESQLRKAEAAAERTKKSTASTTRKKNSSTENGDLALKVR